MQQAVALNNDVLVKAGETQIICEGKAAMLKAVSNAQTYSWTPTASLTNSTTATPAASPVVTTKYYVTTKGFAAIKIR